MTSPESQFISILDASSGGAELISPKVGSKSLPEILPILGLSDIIVFPGMVAPLLVESASSIRLIDDVVAGDRFLGLFCNVGRMSRILRRMICGVMGVRREF